MLHFQQARNRENLMEKKKIRIGMVGHRFMGAVHSQGWRVAPHFFDLPYDIELAVVSGRNEEDVKDAAEKFGFQEWTTDWRSMLTRKDIDVIDICAPSDVHAEIAIEALNAGKHVLCEKPLANTVDECESMSLAAENAFAKGVISMLGFNYRRVPAIQLAKSMVNSGKLGQIRQARVQYLQDWLRDENATMSWRLKKEIAGSGVLGDLGSHAVDTVQFVTGHKITSLTSHLQTFVSERPISASNLNVKDSVTVDDAAAFIATTDKGGLVVIETSRVATGRKNGLKMEVNGTKGSIYFDFEDMNWLHFYDAENEPNAGFEKIHVTENSHPYIKAWWPSGHSIGYEHPFTHQVVDLVYAIAEKSSPSPSFKEGLQVQQVLDAAERSAESRTWEEVVAKQLV